MSDYDPNFIPEKHFALVGQKAVLFHGDRLLILKRSAKAGGAGLWSLPGGGLDTGEEPISSLRREIKEETQLLPRSLSPFAVRSYMHNEDFVVIIGFKGDVESNKLRLNWEHTEFKWVKKEEALEHALTDDAAYLIQRIHF